LLCSCSCSSCWGHIHCLKYCIIVQFHHAFSSLARQHCPAALPAALPGSLARQPCPAALSQQPCPAALSRQPIARQPCLAALPGSLAWQPCPAVRPISTGFDARARSLRIYRITALYYSCRSLNSMGAAAVLTGLNLFLVQFHHAFIMCHQTACARCCTDRFTLVFSRISPCFHYLHARTAVQVLSRFLQVFYANAGKD
jgi:hypothetical protein